MPSILGLTGGAVTVYGALVGALFLFQRSLLYVPPADRAEAAEAGLPGLEAVETRTADGLSLTHWYRPSERADGPVVLLFHGNAGHIGDRVPKYRALYQAGFGVFLAEYRGYNGNPGRPSEDGLMADAASVLAVLAERGVGPERIVLYGESLGTGVAVRLASEGRYAGLVLEAPYSSVAEVAQHHYWYVPARWLIQDKWDSMGRIGRVETPLLILLGGRDRTVPAQFGQKLFEAAPGPKDRIYLAEAGHTDFYDFAEAREGVVGFIEGLALARVRAAE